MFDRFKTRLTTTIHLREGELLAHRGAKPAHLRVLCGAAWVTCSNDLDDHFLPSGTGLTLPRGSRTLIGAETDAVLRIETEHWLPAVNAALRRTLGAWRAAATMPHGQRQVDLHLH